MALIVPSSFNGIDAGLHALSFFLVSMYTNWIYNEHNYLQKHKLFTDEFHYLK